MRKGFLLLTAALLAIASPARAQFVNPFSGNWLFGSAVTADAVLNSASSDKGEDKVQCTSHPAGRDGLRYTCSTVPAARQK